MRNKPTDIHNRAVETNLGVHLLIPYSDTSHMPYLRVQCRRKLMLGGNSLLEGKRSMEMRVSLVNFVDMAELRIATPKAISAHRVAMTWFHRRIPRLVWY